MSEWISSWDDPKARAIATARMSGLTWQEVADLIYGGYSDRSSPRKNLKDIFPPYKICIKICIKSIDIHIIISIIISVR